MKKKRFYHGMYPPSEGGGYASDPTITLYSNDFLAGEWQPPCYDIQDDGTWKRTDPTEDWIEVRADGWFRKRPEKNADDLRPKPISYR